MFLGFRCQINFMTDRFIRCWELFVCYWLRFFSWWFKSLISYAADTGLFSSCNSSRLFLNRCRLLRYFIQGKMSTWSSDSFRAKSTSSQFGSRQERLLISWELKRFLINILAWSDFTSRFLKPWELRLVRHLCVRYFYFLIFSNLLRIIFVAFLMDDQVSLVFTGFSLDKFLEI